MGLSFGVLGLLELTDSNSAVREDGPDFHVSTHRSDKIGERADVHVSSALDFGNGRLVYAQDFPKVLLRQETSRAQLVKRHLLDDLCGLRLGLGMGLWRHLALKLFEVLSHLVAYLPFEPAPGWDAWDKLFSCAVLSHLIDRANP